jgi:hypothetical protein
LQTLLASWSVVCQNEKEYSIMWNLTTPVTGGAQTGFTAPTYTIVTDVAPDVNGKQVAVTALGGTQAGVTVHSVQSPFTIALFRPKTFKVLGKTNPVTGLLPNVPKNTWVTNTRKGVVPLAGQPASLMTIRTTMDIPAGADTASPAEIRAAIAAHIGALNQQSAGLGDSLVSGLF